MKEQRKYPRFDVVANIKVRKLDGKDQVDDAFVKNISAEGFCFFSKEQYKLRDTIEIEITEKITEELPIRVKGEVVWSNKNSNSSVSLARGAFLTGIRVLGIRKTDEARFAMLYCERMLAELKGFLRM